MTTPAQRQAAAKVLREEAECMSHDFAMNKHDGVKFSRHLTSDYKERIAALEAVAAELEAVSGQGSGQNKIGVG